MTEKDPIDTLDQNLDQLDADGFLQSAFDNSKVHGSVVDVGELIQMKPVNAKISIERKPFTTSWHIAVGACIFLAVSLVPLLLGGNQKNSALAWQDFSQRVNEVRSVQYRQAESCPGSNHPTRRSRVMILGKHLQRVEYSRSKSFWEQVGDALEGQGGIETEDGYGISISDLLTGKIVSLDPANKKYTLLTHYVVNDSAGEQLSKTKIEAEPEVDF